MRSNLSFGAVTSALVALLAFQNLSPAYASHHQLLPAMDNVKTFGAMGDGITDDTAAIQNAANDALASNRVLFFPPGTYLHAGIVSFNSIAVTGSGTASVLLAADRFNSAVLLTGSQPSIQNIVVSTAGLGLATPTPSSSTLLVQDANSFTVSTDTIVQGIGHPGVNVINSSVGLVNACVCDGSGVSSDIGVQIGQSHNVSVTYNLFQNEGTGIFVSPVLPTCQSIALLSNTIGNVTYPISALGIDAEGTAGLDIAQNTIQMANSAAGLAIWSHNNDSFNVTNNNTWGASVGIRVEGSGPSGSLVNQNIIHNCGTEGIVALNLATSAVRIIDNAFGECGILDSGSSIFNTVILVAGSDASGATTFVQNNSYQGHLNGLNDYITCEFVGPHIPPSNVTGNTQTQTSLGNSI